MISWTLVTIESSFTKVDTFCIHSNILSQSASIDVILQKKGSPDPPFRERKLLCYAVFMFGCVNMEIIAIWNHLQERNKGHLGESNWTTSILQHAALQKPVRFIKFICRVCVHMQSCFYSMLFNILRKYLVILESLFQ